MQSNNGRGWLKQWGHGVLRAAGLWLCAALVGPAQAQAQAQAQDETLARVQRTGRIVLGAHDRSMPLSYLGAGGQHIGYHMDVCLRVVKAIQQRLDLPSLQVVTVPTTVATRLALLNNGSIDIECAHNPVRASTLSQALLSHATMLSEQRLMTTQAQPQLSLFNLAGKSVGITTGDSAAAALRLQARKQGISLREVFGRTASDTFELLETGRVDAVAFPAPYLLAQRALAADPGRYRLADGVLLVEPIALMFRLQDEELHALANQVLAGMMKSGEMARLYERWFMQPIPGLPQALGLPLPPALQSLFDAPGSEMLNL